MPDADAEGAAPRPAGRRGLVAVIVALLVGASVLVLFAGRGRKPPAMSPTLEHQASLMGRNAEACLSCHARGAAPRRSPNHTGRQDCWSCHAVAP